MPETSLPNGPEGPYFTSDGICYYKINGRTVWGTSRQGNPGSITSSRTTNLVVPQFTSNPRGPQTASHTRTPFDPLPHPVPLPSTSRVPFGPDSVKSITEPYLAPPSALKT
ncbi:hypothetical protein HD806DRAFT_535151 [Xylariaceae sp. AK1471]|nr:hypothetical protein HD806DRAFT_535151 [Xylariaceae sp. AK1471]